jgi:hypothetical protein
MRFLAFKLSQSNLIRSEVMRPLGVLIETNKDRCLNAC